MIQISFSQENRPPSLPRRQGKIVVWAWLVVGSWGPGWGGEELLSWVRRGLWERWPHPRNQPRGVKPYLITGLLSLPSFSWRRYEELQETEDSRSLDDLLEWILTLFWGEWLNSRRRCRGKRDPESFHLKENKCPWWTSNDGGRIEGSRNNIRTMEKIQNQKW